jgi:hypothetical protein
MGEVWAVYLARNRVETKIRARVVYSGLLALQGETTSLRL